MAYIGNVSGFDDVDAEQIKDGAVSDVKISDVDHSKVTGLGAEISTAVSNLVDSSPESLNTLNELAAALGDDASFSTTVTNSIATKLPLAGGTMTGDTLHGDNVKATYGAGGDLEIYHDGSHSRIADRGTGDLRIYGDSLQLNSWTSGENYLTGETDGAVTLFNNGAAKLTTTSTGIDVTGTVTADGLILDSNDSLTIGTGNYLYADLTATEIASATLLKIVTNSAERMRIDSSGNVGIGTNSPAAALDVVGGAIIKGTTDLAATFKSSTDSGNASIAQIRAVDSNSSHHCVFEYKGYQHRFLNDAGTERMRIDSSGKVGIGTATSYGGALTLIPSANPTTASATTSQLRIGESSANTAYSLNINYMLNAGVYKGSLQAIAGGSPADLLLNADGGNVLVGKTTTGTADGVQIEAAGAISLNRSSSTALYLNRKTTDGDMVQFRKDGTTVGSIRSISGTVSGIVFDPRNVNSGGAGIGGTNGDSIVPMDRNSVSDADIDLGFSNLRWRDLYIAGGIHLGGTGSANKLDDYEEGTWTPVISDATTGGNLGTTSGVSGYDRSYTKIGSLVNVRCRIINMNTTGMGLGNIYIQGLPFQANGEARGVVITSNFTPASNSISLAPTVLNNTSYISLHEGITGSTRIIANSSQFASGSADLYINLTYQTD